MAMGVLYNIYFVQASHFGHLPVVELLLIHEAHADFCNSKGEHSHTHTHKHTQPYTYSYNITLGTTALMRASQEGHVDIARVLLKHNVDVNKKNLEGRV